MSKSALEFRQGVIDIFPVIAAASVIGLLWGTLAASKGLSPLETGLMSASIFAGAAQFVAIELWQDPAPWFFLTMTVLIVNVRHVLMGASLSRHMGNIPSGCQGKSSLRKRSAALAPLSTTSKLLLSTATGRIFELQDKLPN